MPVKVYELKGGGVIKKKYNGKALKIIMVACLCFKIVSIYELIRQISMQIKTVLFKGTLVDCYLSMDY